MKIQFKKTVQILVLSLFTVSSLMGQSSVFKSRVSYQTLSDIWELEPENNHQTFSPKESSPF